MNKSGRFGKYGDAKRKAKIRTLKSVPMKGRDIIRFEEHFQIAPKHPGMGRR